MNQQRPAFTATETCEQKYKTARINLLLMIGLTVVNLILLFTGSDMMMLFSATIPYLAAIYATMPIFEIFFPFLMGLAVVTLLLYLACWFFSKKHPAWMIVALVMFAIDTLAMIGLYWAAGDATGIMDIVIHAWVLYYLIIGVVNGLKLRKQAKQPEPPAEAPYYDPADLSAVPQQPQNDPADLT